MGHAEGAGEVFEMLLLKRASKRLQQTRREGAVLLLGEIRDDVRWCLPRSDFGRPWSFGSLQSPQVNGAHWTARRRDGEVLRSALGVVMHLSSFARSRRLSDRPDHVAPLRRSSRSLERWLVADRSGVVLFSSMIAGP